MVFRRDRIGPALRLALARRPWIRWLAAGLAAAATGWLVLGQLQAVDAARAEWTDLQTVLVAAHEHEPGDELTVRMRELPTVAIPRDATLEIAPGTLVRQHITAGEVITNADIASAGGPAAAASSSDVVVPIQDGLLAAGLDGLSVGLDVAVHSEGLVLAEAGRIVYLEHDVVFVAVDADVAAAVSAAAQQRLAAIVFLA
ncbi:MAG: hypothetical protein AB8G14_11235 [Ilumatobacter sp.]